MLGIQTELYLDRDRTSVEERSGWSIARTPQNPGYYQGNFLLFAHPPAPGDRARWLQLFDEAFENDARVKHAAFQWDAHEGLGAADEFAAAGFTLEERDVMIAQDVASFPIQDGLNVRTLASDADWEAQLRMQLNDVPAVHDTPSYAAFKAAQIVHQRAITARDGVWLGAFAGETLAGSCGIFPAGPGLARFQDVHVEKHFRNRGIARALVGAAASAARVRFGSRRFVIVADANGFARRIYERAGFRAAQREALLWIARRR